PLGREGRLRLRRAGARARAGAGAGGRLMAAPATAVAHPLDPLSADEIAAAAAIVRAARPLERVRFVTVTLREPPKAAVLAGGEVEREALVVLLDNEAGSTHELVVALAAGAIRSERRVPDAQPPFLAAEYLEFE